MDAHDALRAQLVTRLETLCGRAARIEQDLRKPGDPDWVERANEIENDEVLEGLDTLTLAEVNQLRRAIERIDKATYGTCTLCGSEIGAARLAALPAATTCLGCAATHVA
jgi:RNA polymerase-binding transcription factor DksA